MADEVEREKMMEGYKTFLGGGGGGGGSNQNGRITYSCSNFGKS
jgi:hypothetical protein